MRIGRRRVRHPGRLSAAACERRREAMAIQEERRQQEGRKTRGQHFLAVRRSTDRQGRGRLRIGQRQRCVARASASQAADRQRVTGARRRRARASDSTNVVLGLRFPSRSAPAVGVGPANRRDVRPRARRPRGRSSARGGRRRPGLASTASARSRMRRRRCADWPCVVRSSSRTSLFEEIHQDRIALRARRDRAGSRPGRPTRKSTYALQQQCRPCGAALQGQRRRDRGHVLAAAVGHVVVGDRRVALGSEPRFDARRKRRRSASEPGAGQRPVRPTRLAGPGAVCPRRSRRSSHYTG